jgi:hypothetical protein
MDAKRKILFVTEVTYRIPLLFFMEYGDLRPFFPINYGFVYPDAGMLP